MTQQEINNLKVNYEIVQSDYQIAKKIVSHEGFYNFWFEQLALPDHQDKTKIEVFNVVNDLYKKLLNQPTGKYSSYNSFQTTVTRLRKTYKLS